MGYSTKSRYLIIPTDNRTNAIATSQCLIVIFMHYQDTVKDYFLYLDNIVDMDNIDVLLVTDSDSVRRLLLERYGNKIKIIHKPNRGRDVAALLVAAKDIIQKYPYFCFIHDKKAKKDVFKNDVELWIKNLWDNMLASKEYVNNVVTYLENNDECGLLVPPEPFGRYVSGWYCSSWSSNYENVVDLAKKIKLNVTINRNINSISLGTVFWARTVSLNKLLNYGWTYEDFDEEPMADDGTISHAIERIIPYVVEDAGYKSKTVMTQEYSCFLLDAAQDFALKSNKVLNEYLGLNRLHQIERVLYNNDDLKDFFIRNKKVFLYGAGKGGRGCLHVIRMLGYEPAGFIETKPNDLLVIDGVRVFSLEEVKMENDDFGIVIAVMKSITKHEIKDMLDNKGITNYIFWMPLL